MSLAIEVFVENVRSFCAWVEARDHDLPRARQLLLSLMSGIPHLPASPANEQKFPNYPHQTYEESKATHARLADFPIQYYREIFDPLLRNEDEPVTGDAHDDLADIYGELWHGLQAHDQGDGVYAIQHWRESYFQHWGEHAASALKAIDHFYRSNLPAR